MKYPISNKRDTTLEIHGIVRQDEYRWLQDKTDPEVLAHIENENEYVKDWMSDTEELQETLYQEIRGHVVEEDESVRTRYKKHEYFTRTFEGKEYVAYYRVDDEGNEECLLDGNVEAEGKEYWAMRNFTISPSEKLLAYATDVKGEELYTPHVKNLETGEVKVISEKVSNTGIVFESDDSAVYFVRPDKTYRPYQVCRYDLATEEVEVIFEESDGRFFVSVDVSKDEKTVYISSDSELTSHKLWRAYEDVEAEFVPVMDRVHEHSYDVVRYDDFWIFLSDRGDAKNFQVLKLGNGKDFWSEATVLVPESKEYHLDGVDEFKDFIVIYKTGNARNEIDILDLETGNIAPVRFDTEAHEISPEEMNDFEGNTFRFSYENPKQPVQIWEMDRLTGDKKLLKEQIIKGGFNPEDYVLEQRWYESTGGVKVPATVMYHKDTKLEDAPVYLYGYGSYGLSYLPAFSQSKVSLIDRGIVHVHAHIRGGGDLGKYWYLNGKFLKKKHTFEDFIAVAEGLCDEGVTSPEKLVIHGGSAGGMLIGAVMNMRPDLFAGAIADVPFVDVINTMLDETLPLTINEYEEWGNPNEKEYYEYMASYSPYDNIQSGVKYPVTLAIAGLNDPRVMYWEPAKWTARLRDRITNPQDVLCKIYTSGHSGTTGRFAYLREIAFRYAFVLKVLG